jgi:hypothetical protein
MSVTFGLEDSDYVTVDDDRRGELPPTPYRLSHCWITADVILPVALLNQPSFGHRATEQRPEVDGAVLTINRDADVLGPTIDDRACADFVLASRFLHLQAERSMIKKERWC